MARSSESPGSCVRVRHWRRRVIVVVVVVSPALGWCARFREHALHCQSSSGGRIGAPTVPFGALDELPGSPCSKRHARTTANDDRSIDLNSQPHSRHVFRLTFPDEVRRLAIRKRQNEKAPIVVVS